MTPVGMIGVSAPMYAIFPVSDRQDLCMMWNDGVRMRQVARTSRLDRRRPYALVSR